MPHPADMVKIIIIAFVMIYLINTGLRAAGLGSYTTKGQ